MSLETEAFDLLTQLGISQPPAEPTPQVVEPAAVTPVPVALTPEPIVPKVEPQVQTVAPVESVEQLIDPNALVEDWNSSEPVQVAPVTPVLDVKALANELGFAEATTKEELIAAVKAKTKDFAAEDLAKANEIAKQGGNYLEYLGVASTNWKDADPVLLFENYIFDLFAKSGKTAEEVNNYLDKTDELEKELRGQELKSQYINYQQQQKAQIEQQTRLEKQQRDSIARRTLDGMVDVYGFKLNSLDKDALFNEFSSKPVGKALLSYSGGDYKKALESLFLFKYGPTVDKVRRQQIENASKRVMLKEFGNAKITSPGSPAAPEVKKAYDIQDYLSELQQKTGL